jgi:putative SOS response-associated peptidase YedK
MALGWSDDLARQRASDLWLTGEPDAAASLMKPANEDALVSRPVSKAVGNVKNNGPELLA